MNQEIKNSIFGRYFWTAFIVMLICLLGLSVPEWICSATWDIEYRQSALQQSISGIFFGGVMLILPFCAALPYSLNQVDELRTSTMSWKLIRASVNRYATWKILATTVSGGVAIALAFIIHSLVWNIIALPCDPTAHPYHAIAFASNSLYVTWYSTLYGLPMYTSISVGLFISGAEWATVALAVAIWIPDRLLTVTIPTCIYYLLSANVLQHLFGWEIPHPATLFNDALTKADALNALIEDFVIFVIACIIYRMGLKRRAQDV